VASSEALDVLHRAMRPVSHRRIRMVIEIVVDLPAFFVASISLLVGAALKISIRKKYFQTFFSQCKLVDMVCLMKSHQGRFQKKSFSGVLCAFSRVFFLFCWGK